VRSTQAPADRVVFFENVERRFSGQARFMTALAGLTGFYMLVRLDLWDRFLSVAYWWMHAMVTIWLLFTLMLLVAERYSSIDGSSLAPRRGPNRPSISSSGCIRYFWC
jgi:hypothetical protein